MEDSKSLKTTFLLSVQALVVIVDSTIEAASSVSERSASRLTGYATNVESPQEKRSQRCFPKKSLPRK